MNDLDVLITVPHAGCFVNPFRMCDTRAYEAAQILHQALNSYDLKNQVFANTAIPRFIMDMNRFVSRDTRWRKLLSEVLREKKPRWIIDMHSFPSDTIWGDRSGLKIEILHDEHPFPLYVHQVLKELQKIEPTMSNLDQGKWNDIMDQVLENNRRNLQTSKVFLLEVNESSQSFSKNELEKVMKILARFIRNSIFFRKQEKNHQ